MAACATCGAEAPAGARFCPSCGAALARAQETRKVVTVLFCDWVASTPLGEGLEPESLRRVQGAYFELMRGVLERHGGTVEKFIGDAVMAVFGIPRAHEDDALRAVRAAVEAREGLAELNERLAGEHGVRISVRTGINTGEVIAGDPSTGQAFVTGHAVVIAKRLEESAQSGAILIGDATRALVRDAAVVEPVGPLALKGTVDALTAWTLLGVVAGAPAFERRLDAPLVGREHELLLLRRAFERATGESAGHLFTILGPPGVGKSRLVKEVLAEAGRRAAVLVGRCPPYGEGVTFSPLAEIVRAAAGAAPRDDAAEVLRRVEELLAEDSDGAAAAERVAAAVGLADAPAPPEETFWAVRKLILALARRRPLVVVVDDVHWAEATFLDLLEHLVRWIRDAPVLLVCLARPDLLEERPTWAGGMPNATTILLEPLAQVECELLLRQLGLGSALEPELTRRIIDASEGNPLFVEEIVASLAESGALRRERGVWVTGEPALIDVPPTIQALLAARLERLLPDERALLDAAAAVGGSFTPSAIDELVGVDAQRVLAALVRKELLRPDTTSWGGDEAFRFRHVLIREAVYRAMPKERRAELHERYADWLEQNPGDRAAELQEVVGHHLAQAYRNRIDLGPKDARAAELGRRAADNLVAAGRRAFARGDLPASVGMLTTARDLLDDESRRVEIAPLLGSALAELGHYARATALVSEAVQGAAAQADPVLRAHALLVQNRLRAKLDPVAALDELVETAEESIRVFAAADDEVGLARAWHALAGVQFLRCQFAAAAESYEHAAGHAERAGDQRLRASILNGLAAALSFGPTPVPQAIRGIEQILSAARGDPTVQALAVATLGRLKAMEGRFDEARLLCDEALERLEDLGVDRWVAIARVDARARIELLAGDHARAAQELRAVYESIRGSEDLELIAETTASLAQAAWALGEFDEAERFSRLTEEVAPPVDRSAQFEWRQSRAKVLARKGELDRAEALAREAVALATETDALSLHGDALLDLATVLSLADRRAEAAAAVEDALSLYERKGDRVSAARARSLLDGFASVDPQATRA